MRIPLAVSLESRDGGVSKDAIVRNGIVEVKGEGDLRLRKRPGTSDVGLIKAGVAQLLYSWNGLQAIQDDTLSNGTIATIVSAPAQDVLTPAAADLPFSAQETGSDAATQYLMIKNRTNAWTVNRAGTVTAITFGGDMGSATHSLTSLTRSGTTATATTTMDTGLDVGESVTIAGASPADYNGVKTVTGVTLGVYAPARDIALAITRSGTTATATSTEPHGLSSGTYTISGAGQSGYNGSKSITVTSPTTFTFTVTTSGVSGSSLTGTWNPADKDSAVTLSDGDLIASISPSGSSRAAVRGSIGKSSGAWFWEVTVTSSYITSIGVANTSMPLTNYVGQDANSWGYQVSGFVYHNGAATAVAGGAYTTGDVIGVLLDMDAGQITFYKNGSAMKTVTGLTGTLYAAVSNSGSGPGAVLSANFGATAFAYDVIAPASPATGSPIITTPAASVPSTFTYAVTGSPVTPATGAITAAIEGGTVPGIAYINGYFAVMDVNGVIWSTDDLTTWNALDFITAQNENGQAAAIAKSGSYLVAFKQWSTEFFYDAQNATGSPFSPVDNGFTQVGCASGWSVAEVSGSLLWISQAQELGRSVHMLTGLESQPVSTPDVGRILDAADLTTVHAYGLKIDGHALYILTLVASNITLVYDLESKVWGQWSSLTLGSSVPVASILRSGTTATVTTGTAHGVADGAPVKLAGATQSEYNGIFQACYVSPTVFTIEVEGGPTTPATGTILAYPYTESYFKFTKYVNHEGANLLLHESDGHLYQLLSERYQDAGLPIDLFTRTTRLDGGTTARKKMPRIGVVGDSVDDILMVRWSDDDCATFTAYQIVRLDNEEPELRRCGAFKRRTIETRHIGNNPIQLAALELEISQ